MKILCALKKIFNFTDDFRNNAFSIIISLLVAIIIFIVSYDKAEKRLIKKVFLKKSNIKLIIWITFISYMIETFFHNKCCQHVEIVLNILITIDLLVSFRTLLVLIKLSVSEHYYYNCRKMFINHEAYCYEHRDFYLRNVKDDIKRISHDNDVNIEICNTYGKKEFIYDYNAQIKSFNKKEFLKIIKEDSIKSINAFYIFDKNYINTDNFIYDYNISDESIEKIKKCFNYKKIKSQKDENVSLVIKELINEAVTSKNYNYVEEFLDYIIYNDYYACNNIFQKTLYNSTEDIIKKGESIEEIVKIYKYVCIETSRIDAGENIRVFEAYYTMLCSFSINLFFSKEQTNIQLLKEVLNELTEIVTWNIPCYNYPEKIYDYVLSMSLKVIVTYTYSYKIVEDNFIGIYFSNEEKYSIYNYQFILALIIVAINNPNNNIYTKLLEKYLRIVKIDPFEFKNFLDMILEFDVKKTKIYTTTKNLPLYSDVGQSYRLFDICNISKGLLVLVLVMNNITFNNLEIKESKYIEVIERMKEDLGDVELLKQFRTLMVPSKKDELEDILNKL